MEASFGTDFSSVRVQEGSQASQLGARAYAQGTDLHFAPGQYQPNTQSGQALIGHELAHVVQQSEAADVAMPKLTGQPIQCFGSQEHQSLGDTATNNASYDVGSAANDRFELTHGDIIALNGDYFLAGPTTKAGGTCFLRTRGTAHGRAKVYPAARAARDSSIGSACSRLVGKPNAKAVTTISRERVMRAQLVS